MIVTIIVIIILAAAVILTLSKNNPVGSAKEAKFKEDIRNFQSELSISISKEYLKKQGQRDEKISLNNFEEIKKIIQGFNKNYTKKIEIQKDELVYVPENVSQIEEKWLEELGIRAKSIDAKVVFSKPEEFYGKYVLNYTTDHEETKEAVKKWRIFFSDSKNIYLISEFCPQNKYFPKGANGGSLGTGGAQYNVFFSGVQKDYNGSTDINDIRIKSLNNEFFAKEFESNNYNMKGIAYILDVNIWDVYKGKNAEYAIGSPTLELFLKSYNQIYKNKIEYIINDNIGYQIGTNDSYSQSINLDMVTEFNNENLKDLYFFKQSGYSKYWLASPAYNLNYTNRIYFARYDNYISSSYYDGSYIGDGAALRPVICLKSDVLFKEVKDGFLIIN